MDMGQVLPPGLDAFAPWLSRWRLTPDGEPFETQFGNLLVPVLRRGQSAMLKIAGGEEERRGGALMAWWKGEGAARVLARKGEAILLERLIGPRDLAAMSRNGGDVEVTLILCQTAARLHAPRSEPPPCTLIPLDRWFGALAPAAATHDGAYRRAWVAARRLLAEPRDEVVLHGDLHHENVRDGGPRGWCAIDPKGLWGERAFDYANLFRNPCAEVALAPGALRRRLDLVCGTAGLEPRRMLSWVLVYAGLGASWSLQGGQDPSASLAIAELAAAELGL